MAQHREYNSGPVNYLLGHGKFCTHEPPRIITTLESNLHYIALASKYTKEKGYTLVGSHSAYIVRFFIRVREELADHQILATSIHGILEGYMTYVQKPSMVHDALEAGSVRPYVQYVSKHCILPEDIRDILVGGHKFNLARGDALNPQRITCDIKMFQDRIEIMGVRGEHPYKPPVQLFQKEHMDFKENSIAYSWEIRERMIWYPHLKISIERDTTSITPNTIQYLKLRYYINNLKNYRDENIQKDVIYMIVYLNKSALRYDIDKLELSDTQQLVKYTKRPGIYKHGDLSGKHFIFTYIKCAKKECGDVHRNCDKLLTSTVINNCISKLHVLVDEDNGRAEVLEKYVMLFNSDDLGDIIPVEDVAQPFKYYDFAMPPDSTIVLGSCSGHDTVVNEIFGF